MRWTWDTCEQRRLLLLFLLDGWARIEKASSSNRHDHQSAQERDDRPVSQSVCGWRCSSLNDANQPQHRFFPLNYQLFIALRPAAVALVYRAYICPPPSFGHKLRFAHEKRAANTFQANYLRLLLFIVFAARAAVYLI